jgi:hypothetical protein
MNLDEKNAKELFGEVKRLKAEGGHTVNKEMIFSPLEHKDAVIRLFCADCGYTFELTRDQAEEKLGFGKTLPSIIERGEYLESNGCGACDGKGDIVELKKI